MYFIFQPCIIKRNIASNSMIIPPNNIVIIIYNNQFHLWHILNEQNPRMAQSRPPSGGSLRTSPSVHLQLTNHLILTPLGDLPYGFRLPSLFTRIIIHFFFYLSLTISTALCRNFLDPRESTPIPLPDRARSYSFPP